MRLEEVLALVTNFGNAHAESMARARSLAAKVAAACHKVAQSFSGSFAGYHGRLYYGRFEVPPLSERFSIEWGGLYGVPERWVEQPPEKVKAEIERLAGDPGAIESL